MSYIARSDLVHPKKDVTCIFGGPRVNDRNNYFITTLTRVFVMNSMISNLLEKKIN